MGGKQHSGDGEAAIRFLVIGGILLGLVGAFAGYYFGSNPAAVLLAVGEQIPEDVSGWVILGAKIGVCIFASVGMLSVGLGLHPGIAGVFAGGVAGTIFGAVLGAVFGVVLALVGGGAGGAIGGAIVGVIAGFMGGGIVGGVVDLKRQRG